MADIITLGELLIDLTQSGTDADGNAVFTAYPGGAPANVAVAAARLGAKTGFIGKVGKDAFGKSLKETLEAENVETAGLFMTKDEPTTLAIASIDETGERSFSFYRNPGADTQLTSEEALDALSAGHAGILHIGSLSLTTSPAREACEDAVRFAKENGLLVSYDPNYRDALWESEEKAVVMMKRLLPYADILKVSDEEMVMLTGSEDFADGSEKLAAYGIRLVMVTMGADGVFVRYGSFAEQIEGFQVEVADTNGAGDTFAGAMLAQIAKRDGKLDGIGEDELKGFVRFANKAASLTCSRHGAIPAMPRLSEMGQEFV